MRLAKIAGVVLLSTVLLSSIACATPTYHLSTSVNGQGSVMPSSGDFLEGEAVLLLAVPASGCDFDHWEGAASGDNGLVTITMDSDKSVTAYFVETGHSGSSSGFSVTLPDGWEEMPYGAVEEGTAYYSVSACSGSGAMVIVAEMDASGMSLQTFYDASKIGLETFGDYNILSEEEITIDGMPAKQMIYTVVIGGATSKMLQCVLVKGDTGWLITFSCDPECWDTLEGEFEAILDSFEISKGEATLPSVTPAITDNTPSSTPVYTYFTSSEAPNYTDNDIGFSIYLPSSWMETETGGGIGGAWFADVSTCPGSGAMALIVSETPVASLSSYYSKLKRDSTGMTLVSEEQTTIGGIPAMRHEYTISGENPSHNVDYMLVNGQTGYAMTFMCAPECWSMFENTFDTMAYSFQASD